jgi:acetyltransferase-like isoleucine patch superfamily enzyme
MKRNLVFLTVSVLAAVLPVVAGGVNSSIRVEPGEVVTKDLSTVNGQIHIGDGATVQGETESVNGGVEVGRNAQVNGISVVNGGIEIGEGTVVDGDVETVNGSISMERGTSARAVSTVNGPLNLTGVDVETDVSTYNGDVTLSDGTIVGGNVVIRESKGHSSNRNRKPLRIIIEEGSSVAGDVIVENEDLKVEVYLRGGTVAGEIRGAKVVEK